MNIIYISTSQLSYLLSALRATLAHNLSIEINFSVLEHLFIVYKHIPLQNHLSEPTRIVFFSQLLKNFFGRTKKKFSAFSALPEDEIERDEFVILWGNSSWQN